MKVYIVLEVQYEGDTTIEGVFSTREKANLVKEELSKHSRYSSLGIWLTIEEHEVE